MKTSRILVVDDESSIRKVLTTILEGMGHEVRTAQDGREGLEIEIVGEQIPDVAITDIFMPGMSGLEFIQAMKKQQPDVKLVAMSAVDIRDEFEILVLARQYGTDATLEKPFGVERVREVLEEILN